MPEKLQKCHLTIFLNNKWHMVHVVCIILCLCIEERCAGHYSDYVLDCYLIFMSIIIRIYVYNNYNIRFSPLLSYLLSLLLLDLSLQATDVMVFFCPLPFIAYDIVYRLEELPRYMDRYKIQYVKRVLDNIKVWSPAAHVDFTLYILFDICCSLLNHSSKLV